MHKVTIEAGPNAYRVQKLILEAKDATNSMLWTGSKWLAEFDEVELALGNLTIDFYVELGGPPNAACEVRVKIDGHDAVSVPPSRFDGRGNLIAFKSFDPRNPSGKQAKEGTTKSTKTKTKKGTIARPGKEKGQSL